MQDVHAALSELTHARWAKIFKIGSILAFSWRSVPFMLARGS